MARAVENVVHVTQDSVNDDQLIGELKSAAAAVAQALNELLSHVRSVGEPKKVVIQPEPTPVAVDTIYTATDRIVSSRGDASEMVKQAKVLAKATVQLINDLKGQAETQADSDVQKRLILAARMLADATAKLVDAAKGCKSNPHDSASQAALTKAAEELRDATSQAASSAARKSTFTSRIEVEERPIPVSLAPPVPPPPPPEVLEEIALAKKVQQIQQQVNQRQQSELTVISESHLEVNYPDGH